MKMLYVLYDSECGLCVHSREWLETQPAFLNLKFIPRTSLEARTRFPDLFKENLSEELIVVSDEGGIYRGAHAWIMCLYSLEKYRELANRLSSPALMPLARQVCGLISRNRLTLSHLMRFDAHEDLKTAIQCRL